MTVERDASDVDAERVELSALLPSPALDGEMTAIAARAANANAARGAAVSVARWFVPLAAAVALACWSASAARSRLVPASPRASLEVTLASSPSSDAWLLFSSEVDHGRAR